MIATRTANCIISRMSRPNAECVGTVLAFRDYGSRRASHCTARTGPCTSLLLLGRGERQLCGTGCDGTRHTASNTREHTAKFRLDSGLTSRPAEQRMRLRARTLDSLRQRRDAALTPVQLLDREQVTLLLVGLGGLRTAALSRSCCAWSALMLLMML